MEIKLFNTLTRKKEVFKEIKKGEVRVYSCGPTVYWYQTIGNMRAYLFVDVLRRVLEYNGKHVKHVINVTDVGHLTSDSDEGEDKMELAASKEGKKAGEIAKYYFSVFLSDLGKLNVKMPWKWPLASEHIKEQISLISKLEKKGFTYRTSDGIYFDSSKFKDYGKLARLKLEGLQEGKRVGKGEKKHIGDFALWKFSEEKGKRQQEWESPWGLGFPGWHLECSAMSMKYLGKHFDIHTGGEDHIPVHHTNEIAQSEAATGEKFVNYWLHNAFLVDKEGRKVSKSKGGLYTISELEGLGFAPLVFRYFTFLTHYRKPLHFTLEHLESAKSAFQKLRRRVGEIRHDTHKGKDLSKDYETLFLEAVNDDLNMPKAIQVLWKIVEDFNFDPKKKISLLEKMDSVFGLDIGEMKEFENEKIPEDVMKLVEEREALRKDKDYGSADRIRHVLDKMGYEIEDLPSGVRVRRKLG